MLFDKLVEQFKKKKKIRIIKSRNFFVYFIVAHASLASDRTQSSLIPSLPFSNETVSKLNVKQQEFSNLFWKKRRVMKKNLVSKHFETADSTNSATNNHFSIQFFYSQISQTRHLEHLNSSFARSIVPSRKSRSTDLSKYSRPLYQHSWKISLVIPKHNWKILYIFNRIERKNF